MKGLLRCDWYQILKHMKIFLLLMLILIGFSALRPDNGFFLFYPLLLPTMIPVTLLGYYDQSKFYIYADTTPLSREKYVSEKYLISFLFLLVIFLLEGLSQACFMGLTPELLCLLTLFPVIGLLGPSLTLPLLFHFGVQKGRIAYYLCVGIFCSIAIFCQDIADRFRHISASVLLLSILAIFILSWRLSIWLYQRREL